jgi:hypothetical protein
MEIITIEVYLSQIKFKNFLKTIILTTYHLL